MKEMPKFKSLEEVKEFISSTDNTNFGAIVFVDENGKSVQLTMNEFIERVGFDEAARFLYENNEGMTGMSMDKNEIKDIMRKFEKDPDSLTDEEKTVLYMILNSGKNIRGFDPLRVFRDVSTVITKTLVDIGGDYTKTYSGMLSIFLTIMQEALLTSSNLSVYNGNNAILDEIIRTTKEQIVIPEGIDEASLLLTLINIIGDRYVGKDFTGKMPVNYHDFVRNLDLNEELIFEHETPDSESEEDDKEDEDIMELVMTQKAINEYSKEIYPDVRKYLGLDDKPKANIPESKSNIVNVDIRKTLKEDRK